MPTDYIVASLPTLRFGENAPMTWERFVEACGGKVGVPDKWRDIETQLRNAMAEARGGAQYAHEARGCSLYWKKRVLDCFAERDVIRREEMLDRVWWDAAGELTDVADPLGKGAIWTYAVRLKIALKRSAISTASGNAVFDRLTAETRITF